MSPRSSGLWAFGALCLDSHPRFSHHLATLADARQEGLLLVANGRQANDQLMNFLYFFTTAAQIFKCTKGFPQAPSCFSQGYSCVAVYTLASYLGDTLVRKTDDVIGARSWAKPI